MMISNEVGAEMKEYIEVVKATEFYSKFVDKLYVCEETPDILWATFKAPYTKRDEIAFETEIESFAFEFWDMVMADGDPRFAQIEFKEVR